MVCHAYTQEDLQTLTGLILSPKSGVFVKVENKRTYNDQVGPSTKLMDLV